jgi:hypothetical protein
MAITNAQQYQQLVNKPANGKRPGYRGDDAYGGGRSSRSSGPAGGASSGGNYGGNQNKGGGGGGSNFSGGDDRREQASVAQTQGRRTPTPQEVRNIVSKGPDDRSSDLQTINQLRNQNRFVAEDEDLLPGDTLTTEDIKLNKREQEFKDFLDRRNKVNLFGLSKIFTGPAQKFSDFNASINRPFFEKVIRAGKIPGLSFDSTEEEFEKAYQEYMANRLSGKTDAYGNPMSGFSYDAKGNLVGNFRDDGPDPIPFMPTDDSEDSTEPEDPKQILSSRILGSEFDPTFFAAEGGMAEENDPVGGIMDLESGRQMYFLGKLVKKATRAVKKIAKSPFGKAALLYGLGSLGAGTGTGFFGGLKGKLFGLPKQMITGPVKGLLGTGSSGTMGILGKLGLTKGGGSLMPTIKGGITLASVLPAFFSGEKKDDFDIEEYYRTGELVPKRSVRGDGTIMEGVDYTNFAEGGKAEPVAKKTMPLLDMDGMEKDYREDGGFVPIGRMERADDVPARLSKNEFVFTADAVRNAGEGDIDKGAEVMYNMMKNLESGGEVSEESQGLDGAREMFKTSRRLEEIL